MPNQMSLLGIGGAAVSWAPTDITGGQFWGRSTLGLYQERTGASATTPAAADADPVGSWLDQFISAHHVVAPSDAARPTLKLNIQNGKPVVRFDVIDDVLSYAGSISTSQTGSVFIVYKALGNTGNRTVWSVGTDGALAVTFQDRPASVNNFYLTQYGTGDDDSAKGSSTGAAQAAFGLLEVHSDGADWFINWNTGVETLTVTAGSNDGDWFGDVASLTHFDIGALYVGGYTQWGQIDVCEMLVYDGQVTGADLTALRGYLNGEYALWV